LTIVVIAPATTKGTAAAAAEDAMEFEEIESAAGGGTDRHLSHLSRR